MKKKRFSRVDWQASLLLSVILILFGVSIYLTSSSIYYYSILDSLTHRVENIHSYVEHKLTPEAFWEIDEKEDMQKESYQELKVILENIRELGDLRYLYTAKENKQGELVYVVDGLSESAADFRYPGDLIESEIQKELNEALSGKTVLPNKILDTDWGNIFIAYYPLHDEQNKVVGALGIEIAADVEAAAIDRLSKAILISCLFFCGVSIFASLVIFRRISNPLYRDMSNTDFMTNLKNRNAYEIDRDNWAAQKTLSQLTVVVIDLNNLKLANDRLGHDVGDACIIHAAKILHKLENRKTTAYRYGGDEFILLMEDQPDPMPLLLRAKEEFCKYGSELKIPVALAIGVAQFDKSLDHTIADTQKRADEQMYQDKLKIKASENLNIDSHLD